MLALGCLLVLIFNTEGVKGTYLWLGVGKSLQEDQKSHRLNADKVTMEHPHWAFLTAPCPVCQASENIHLGICRMCCWGWRRGSNVASYRENTSVPRQPSLERPLRKIIGQRLGKSGNIRLRFWSTLLQGFGALKISPTDKPDSDKFVVFSWHFLWFTLKCGCLNWVRQAYDTGSSTLIFGYWWDFFFQLCFKDLSS